MNASKKLLALGLALITNFATADDMVIRWNHVLHSTIRVDSTSPGPTWASRNQAMVQLAVFEAVNSIYRNYQPFYAYVPAAPEASPDAAVAQSAYRMLLALYPAQIASLDINLASSLKNIPSTARDAGVAVGNAAADLVLTQRAGDGSGNNTLYALSFGPGKWRPDPLHPGQTALGPNWGGVTPFTLTSSAQFRAPAPPTLDSPAYAASFDEVRRLGSRNGSERTPDQTEIGVFWGYDRGGLGPPPILYDKLCEVICVQLNFSLEDNARLFAMLNVAMADAGIACWESKYFYNYWRPVGAIREADADGNPATVADPAWEPLGAPAGGPPYDFTPPFPAYPSGHATFGSAICRMLELICGTNNVPFTLVSDEVPAAPRDFSSFTQAALENGRSRIYLGVHWDFDDTEGRAMGRKVADQVFGTKFAPVLRSARVGQNLEVSWPASVKSYRLEKNFTFAPLNWVPLVTPPVVSNSAQAVLLQMPETSFFRLSRTLP